MNRRFLTLALALSVLPVAALADDPPGAPPSPPTTEQRQQLFKTIRSFGQQEEQLQQQMRTQVLNALSAAHRQAVANLIGQLAIAQNPDPSAAAQRLDSMLSSSERQAILSAHASFVSQSKTLHDQMRAQIQSELPADAQSRWMNGHHHAQMPSQRTPDAGTLLLAALAPHPHGMMGMFMHGPGMGPGGPPEGGAPPPDQP